MHTLSASFRSFAHEHDDLPAFHAGYLVLTLLVAAMFNAGFFFLLIVAHMTLDIVKYREVHGCTWTDTISATLRESLTDFALLSLAVVFGIYLHHEAGIVAVSGILRSEAIIARALGMIVPKMEVLSHVFLAFWNVQLHLKTMRQGLRQSWSRGDHLALVIFTLCVGLVIFAPLILSLPSEIFVRLLEREMIPWRW